MNTTIHIATNKTDALVDLLTKSPNKKRNYSLYLTSCYFTTKSAKLLIKRLAEIVRLQSIEIYIDRKSAIAIGKEALLRFCKPYHAIPMQLHAVETTHLFHSKAYALVARSKNEIIDGSLVVGSANLTGQGLTEKRGNVETLLATTDNEVLNEFLLQLQRLQTVTIDELELFKNSDDFNFKYALLREGLFVHKWNESLVQYLSVRYQLSENGRKQTGNDELRDIGFEVENATISKQYFHFLDYTPAHLEYAEGLIKNYGIETQLGHWVPSNRSKSLYDKRDYEEYKNRLTNSLKEQNESIQNKIANDYARLLANNLITPNDYKNPNELFETKSSDLVENDAKLRRIYSKYDVFELPYGIENKDMITNIFNDMISFSESRAKKNRSMKALISAYYEISLDLFREMIQEE